MRLAGAGSREDRATGFAAIRAALDAGYNHFDHADIYGGGACEALFGDFLRENPDVRDRIVLTSKCGIRDAGEPHASSPKRYDFSVRHIVWSVEQSLRRLGVEHLDVLLLHRPDYLLDADEVAGAFAQLRRAGKVAHFGVSNFSPAQVSLLRARLDEPLVANQVEINIYRLDALTEGILDQCQQLSLAPQAWSPLAGIVHQGWGVAPAAEIRSRIAAEIGKQAERFGCDPWVVMLAWLLRHPAGIMPIVGSTSADRIDAATCAVDIDYDRDSWYRLLEARLGAPVP